jgi:hypothetical protein
MRRGEGGEGGRETRESRLGMAGKSIGRHTHIGRGTVCCMMRLD